MPALTFPETFEKIGGARVARHCPAAAVVRGRRGLLRLKLQFVALVVVIGFTLLYYALSGVLECDTLSSVRADYHVLTAGLITGLPGQPRSARSRYLVRSPTCQIPDVDPFDESIRRLLKPAPLIKCSEWPPLTYTLWLDEQGSRRRAEQEWVSGYVLRVDPVVVPYYVHEGEKLSCCYSNVTRATEDAGDGYTKEADNRVNVSPCKVFYREVKLMPEEEYILVRCSSYKIRRPCSRKNVYVNMHGIVPIKPSVAKKMKDKMLNDNNELLSVLMIGFDSMSRLNLLRTMPQTVAYLHRVGYIDLQGYNKIGYNTLPNLMAMLTGHNIDHLKHKYWPNNSIKLDNCPFVWKEFHNHGYTTVYAEDVAQSTFNFEMTGFVKQPTDYYFRPYVLVSFENLMKNKRRFTDVCLGPQSTSDHIFKYATEFLITFKNSPFFALFWLNNFSHEDVNDPWPMDSRVLQFFNEISGTGIHNTTIVIFLSDHGTRLGEIRKTYVGWLEERLPFIYIFLPPWFKDKYPKAYQNLLINRNKLTSPYDLHATLKDILDRGLKKKSKRRNASFSCPKCKSFFSDEIGERSCDDAGIAPQWCPCVALKEIPVNDTLVQKVVMYALDDIRNKLRNFTPNLCAILHISDIIKAFKRVDVNKISSKYDDYVIIFETKPGGGLFESTVRREMSEEMKFFTIGMVSRINEYGNQSHCIHDTELKLYCFCNVPLV